MNDCLYVKMEHMWFSWWLNYGDLVFAHQKARLQHFAGINHCVVRLFVLICKNSTKMQV